MTLLLDDASRGLLIEVAAGEPAALRRPLQPHGTPARARGRRRTGIPPCPCIPCVEVLREANRKRRILLELGHPGRVNAAASVRHLNLLFEAGMTWPQIREATGVSHGSLTRLHQPGAETTTVYAFTQARILAAPIPAPDKRVPGESHVDGTGTRRRLRSLLRNGWTTPALTEHTPISRRQLNRLLRHPRVTVGTRAAVMDLYYRLEDVPGPSAGSALRAERKGWAAPSAWFGVDMDDPNAKPRLKKSPVASGAAASRRNVNSGRRAASTTVPDPHASKRVTAP